MKQARIITTTRTNGLIKSPITKNTSSQKFLNINKHKNSHNNKLKAIKEVFMPALSSTMTEGKIVSWLKKEGEKVSKGEAIVVVESDKADMDVESFNEGYMGSIVVREGDMAPVGVPIAFIAESEGEIEEAQKKAASNKSNGNASTEAPVQPKKAKPVQSENSSIKTDITAQVPKITNTDINVKEPVSPNMDKVEMPIKVIKREDGRIIATPYAKKLAKDMSIDISQVPGSGVDGRITASDVQNYASGQTKPSTIEKPSTVESDKSVPMVSQITKKEEVSKMSELKGKTIPFSALESAVAKNMLESLKVPTFKVRYEVITDEFDKLYARIKPKGVTLTAMIAKACGLAIAKHPIINACCTPEMTGITYNEHVNIAIAVTMEDGGLITPVIKDCDTKDIYTMSREWSDLSKRARQKKLKPDEYNSGTFTISNLGMYGVDSFDAIIPPGTSSIIAISSSKPTVVATKDGLLGIKKVMKITLCCDHRIIYGVQAAEFMKALKEIMENPDDVTL